MAPLHAATAPPAHASSSSAALVQPEDPTLERSFRGHKGAVTSVAFNANLKQLVSGSTDGNVMVWNFKPTLRAYRFAGHRVSMMCWAWGRKRSATCAHVWQGSNGARSRARGVGRAHARGSDERGVARAHARPPNAPNAHTHAHATTLHTRTHTRSRTGRRALCRVFVRARPHRVGLQGQDRAPVAADCVSIACVCVCARAACVGGALLGRACFDMLASLLPRTRPQPPPKTHTHTPKKKPKTIDTLSEGRSAVLKAHTGAVRSVAFSADGQALITGSDDKTAKVSAVSCAWVF